MSNYIATSQQGFCEELCLALGLDPGLVSGVQIVADAGALSPLEVHVEMIVTRAAIEAMLALDWEVVQAVDATLVRKGAVPAPSHRAVVEVTGFGGDKA